MRDKRNPEILFLERGPLTPLVCKVVFLESYAVTCVSLLISWLGSLRGGFDAELTGSVTKSSVGSSSGKSSALNLIPAFDLFEWIDCLSALLLWSGLLP